MKTLPTGSPRSLGAPGCGPSGPGQRVASGPRARLPLLQRPHPLARPAAATLLWRLPLRLPPGPRLLKAPAQGWSEFRGRFYCPFCQTHPVPAQLRSQHLLGPGARSRSPKPSFPISSQGAQAPPPAELNLPRSPFLPRGPEDPHTSRRQEVPTVALHSGSRQPPPDQHWDRLHLGNLCAVLQTP